MVVCSSMLPKKYYNTLGCCKATCSVHTIIICFSVVVCNFLLLKSIIMLLGAAKQQVRFILYSLCGPGSSGFDALFL